MEYTQWDKINDWAFWAVGLNPCCNGIYSMRHKADILEVNAKGLNPCCNGIYSMSF